MDFIAFKDYNPDSSYSLTLEGCSPEGGPKLYRKLVTEMGPEQT